MKNTHYAELDWSEFIEWAERPAEGGTGRNGDHSKAFAGATYKEALAMAKGAGFTDALPKAGEVAGQVEDTITTELFQTAFQSTWEVSGAEVDMGRFLSGEPECMIESQPIRIARQGRAVRVALPICYSAGTPAATILRRGAAVMALCDILARAQHPVEVWVVIANGGLEPRTCMKIKVQAANQPLDEGRLMYAMSHPSMLRQLGFTAQEQYPMPIRRAYGFGVKGGAGYGRGPFNIEPEDFPEHDGTTIILPDISMGEYREWSVEDSVKWVKAQLDRIFA